MSELHRPSHAPDSRKDEPGQHAVDEFDAREHPEDLYRHDAVAEPLYGLDAIGDREIEIYHNQGFLAVEEALSDDEVESARQGMRDLVLGRNPGFKGVQYESTMAQRLQEFSDHERLDAVRKLMHFVDYDERLKAVSEHTSMTAIVRRLLGDREPEMFQDMGLSKPPRIGREKPWHQDCAYFRLPLDTPVVGVWIALDDATLENGCMHVLAGGHREGAIPHWRRRDWQICDADIFRLHDKERPVIAVPLKAGGLMFFSGMVPHGTPHNRSSLRRRALQYHYCPADASKLSADERMKIWGTEGKDLEC